MYVAYSQNLATYVVAIDGTNSNSTYDANKEDDWVDANCMAKWPFAVPFFPTLHDPWKSNPPPAVSAGTAIGVSNLLQMADPVKGGLQSFLTNVASATSTLILAGHSLAGALSPTLALYLYPEPQNSGWKQIVVLPTAGPSPGNEPFTKLFGAAYPLVSSGVGGPYANWNTNYANALDVVPHAWNQFDEVISDTKDKAGNYPSILGVMDSKVGEGLISLVDGKKSKASGGDYQNITKSPFNTDWGYWLWSQNDDGSWQHPPVWTELTSYTDTNPISDQNIPLELMGVAHIDQYDRFFGVTPAPRMPITPKSDTEAAAARKRSITP